MSGVSPSPNRRSVLVSAAAASAASLFFDRLAAAGEAPPSQAFETGRFIDGCRRDDTAIRPFRFNASDEALADLRRRIAATKWPSRELVTDASQGVQLATMRELARYWQTDYDWRKVEARLNALPQFTTNIDGLDIHFIHVRSKHDNASADHRHARMAGLDHRAAEDHRSADQPNGAWRRARRTPSTS